MTKKILFLLFVSLFLGCATIEPNWQAFFENIVVIPDSEKFQDWQQVQYFTELGQRELEYQNERKHNLISNKRRSFGTIDIRGKKVLIELSKNELPIEPEQILTITKQMAISHMGADIVFSETEAELILKVECLNLAEKREIRKAGNPGDFYSTDGLLVTMDIGLRLSTEEPSGKETASCFRSRQIQYYEYDSSHFKTESSRDDLFWQKNREKQILNTLREIWLSLLETN